MESDAVTDLGLQVFDGMNASASVNQACLAAHPDGTECMMGQNTAPYINTPLFIVNSKYNIQHPPAQIAPPLCRFLCANCPT